MLNVVELLTAIAEQKITSIDLKGQEIVDYAATPIRMPLLESDENIHVIAVIPNISLKNYKDTILAFGTEDGDINLWSKYGRKIIKILKGHTARVTEIKLLANGHIVSAAHDKTVRKWDLYSGDCIEIIEGFTRTVRSILCLRDNVLASLHYYNEIDGNRGEGSDERIYLWDSDSGELIKVLPGPKRGFFHECGELSLAKIDGERFAVRYHLGEIYLWNSNNYSFEILQGYSPSVSKQGILIDLPNNKLALSSTKDGIFRRRNEISVYNLATGKIKTWELPSKENLKALKVLPDGRLATLMSDGEVSVWDTHANEQCLLTFNTNGFAENYMSRFIDIDNLLDIVLPGGELITRQSQSELISWSFPLRPIGQSEILQVLKALKLNRSVITLNFAGLPVGDEGAAILAEVLPHHPSLKSIDLRGSFVSERGREILLLANSRASNQITFYFDSTQNSSKQLADTHQVNILQTLGFFANADIPLMNIGVSEGDLLKFN